MNITVLGLWHLGCVTAAVSADYFSVTGLDFDETLIKNLNRGMVPIEEPGLNDLIRHGLENKKLNFTVDPKSACKDADILWVCYDTPVDDNDISDTQLVLDRIEKCIPYLKQNGVVLVSSQLPAGTCKQLEMKFSGKQISFACSPENLRLGKAIEVFRNPGRIVAGVRDPHSRKKVETLLSVFCKNILFMSPESAEMTKHALNSFLALSISYMNEISRLCERVGADAKEVEAALKADERIGPRAYLSPGPAFAGGTLARDVVSLSEIAKKVKENIVLIPAIKASNDLHKNWALEKILKLGGSSKKSSVGILGLTYKPFTNTLRRSSTVELAEQLLKKGFRIKAFDPSVKLADLPKRIAAIEYCDQSDKVFDQADAVILATAWPLFRELPWAKLINQMSKKRILDPGSFISDKVKSLSGVEYFAVGRPSA